MPEEKITKAEPDEIFKWKDYRGEKHQQKVSPACSSTAGRWACMTHGESFDNQLQKDSHIHAGRHRLVWLCNEHGPEAP